MRSTGPASRTSPGAWQLRGPAARHPGSAGIRVQVSGPPFPAQPTPALGMGLGICLFPQTENGTLLPGDQEVAWIPHRQVGPPASLRWGWSCVSNPQAWNPTSFRDGMRLYSPPQITDRDVLALRQMTRLFSLPQAG